MATPSVRADDSESGRGWLWGGTEEVDGGTSEDASGLGWISLNSINCDSDDDGQSEGSTGCPASGVTIADYGVHIPETDGDLNGYAWSENVGWISFQPSDLGGCPDAPCSAYRLGDEIYGWARIIAIRSAGSNAGGYDGWIKLHAVSGDSVSYGLSIDTSTTPNEITGYAWTDEFGWIRAVNVEIATSESLIVCPQAATITIGGTFQLESYYRPGGGRILSCSDVLVSDTQVTNLAATSWTSSDDGIATISATGLVTGVSAGGPIDISASYLAQSATSFINVNSVTLATCGNGTLDAGESCDAGASDNGTCTTAGVPYDHDSNAATSDITCSASCEIKYLSM